MSPLIFDFFLRPAVSIRRISFLLYRRKESIESRVVPAYGVTIDKATSCKERTFWSDLSLHISSCNSIYLALRNLVANHKKSLILKFSKSISTEPAPFRYYFYNINSDHILLYSKRYFRLYRRKHMEIICLSIQEYPIKSDF